MSKGNSLTLAAPEIERRIRLIRGRRVMIDSDLAALYQVPTKVLNQAVSRNRERFPGHFMFRLNKEEAAILRSQIVTLEGGRGHYSKFAPSAFTEYGIVMLCSVLKSRRAIRMNILIVEAFVRLREMIAAHKDLAGRMEKMESTLGNHASALTVIVEEIKTMKALPESPKKRIGFNVNKL